MSGSVPESRGREELLLHLIFDNGPKRVLLYSMDEARRTTFRKKMGELLDAVKFRERETIRLRYLIDDWHTLEQVGRVLGISRERVRMMEANALAKLKHPARKCELDEFIAKYEMPEEV